MKNVKPSFGITWRVFHQGTGRHKDGEHMCTSHHATE
jgi:hypothetical protein